MANEFVTWQQAADAVAFQTYNNSKYLQAADTQYAETYEGSEFGDTIQIKQPVIYTATDGRTLSNQDSKRPKVNLTLNIQKHVAMNFTIDEQAVNLDKFNEDHARPAGEALADSMDVQAATALYQQCYNAIGTPGAGGPKTLFAILETAARMHDFNTPLESPMDLSFITKAINSAYITDSLKGALNANISDAAITAGMIGEAGGMMVGRSHNVPVHVVGDYDGTPLVNGATAEGAAAVVMDGAASDVAGWLKKGDIITLAGVNAVNRINKSDLGYLRQFTVTADVTTAASAASIPVSPPIYAASDGLQNVTALPADNAVITVLGTANASYSQSVGVHSRALGMATVPLPLPAAGEKARSTYKGVSVLLTKEWDPTDAKDIIRADILGGVSLVYPWHACRYYG